MRPVAERLISIICPCFNEEQNINNTYTEIKRYMDSFQERDVRWELLICDNASTDATRERARTIVRADRRVRLIENLNNYGPNRSVWNALHCARGDAVVLCVPADGQDPPELLLELVPRWLDGADLVCGVRAIRNEGSIRFLRQVFYLLLRLLVDKRVVDGLGDLQLIDRSILRLMLLNPFGFRVPRIQALRHTSKVEFVPYEWKSRRFGTSKSDIFHFIDNVWGIVVSSDERDVALASWLDVTTSIGLMVAFAGALFGVRRPSFAGLTLAFISGYFRLAIGASVTREIAFSIRHPEGQFVRFVEFDPDLAPVGRAISVYGDEWPSLG